MAKEEKDPYVEIVKILKSYDEGLPKRVPEAEECGCRMHDAAQEEECRAHEEPKN
jgi:hypothetical protein